MVPVPYGLGTTRGRCTFGAPYGIKRKQMHMAGTLALAANDADLRSWSKVAVRWVARLVSSKAVGTIERNVSRAWRAHCQRFVRFA